MEKENFKNILYKIIGNNIKAKRKELNMSQENLALKMDVARSTLSNIEIGRHQIPLYTLYDLAELFHVDIFDIIPPYKTVLEDYNKNIDDFDKVLSKKLNPEQLESVKQILNDLV